PHPLRPHAAQPHVGHRAVLPEGLLQRRHSALPEPGAPPGRPAARPDQLPPPLVLRGARDPYRVRHRADLGGLPGLREGRGQLRGGALMASAIEVRNVSKHFKLYHEQYHTLKERMIFLRRAKRFEEFHALDDVSFEVEEGTTFGLIENFIDNPVRNYSSGMYIRLGFAVAVHMDPDILLIDEVIAVGDEAFQAKCMERIRKFQEDGKTILIVTHAVDGIRDLCSQAALLSKGRLAAY